MKNGLRPNDSLSVDVYAHRGSTVLAPENTIPAFELALSYGADVLEIDVRLSRDGHVIVTHDARIDRTCNEHGAVADMTLSKLKQVDAAHHFTDLQGKSYRGQGVSLSTLDELFERFPDTRINVDIKDNTPLAAAAVASCIERAGAQSRVNVGSFHAPALKHFRRQAPEVTTAASQQEVAQLYFFSKRQPHPLSYEYLQIPFSYFGIPLATPRFMDVACKRQINLVYWTINDTATMDLLVGRGAHGLVTDRVDLACEHLGKSGSKAATA